MNPTLKIYAFIKICWTQATISAYFSNLSVYGAVVAKVLHLFIVELCCRTKPIVRHMEGNMHMHSAHICLACNTIPRMLINHGGKRWCDCIGLGISQNKGHPTPDECWNVYGNYPCKNRFPVLDDDTRRHPGGDLPILVDLVVIVVVEEPVRQHRPTVEHHWP